MPHGANHALLCFRASFGLGARGPLAFQLQGDAPVGGIGALLGCEKLPGCISAECHEFCIELKNPHVRVSQSCAHFFQAGAISGPILACRYQLLLLLSDLPLQPDAPRRNSLELGLGVLGSRLAGSGARFRVLDSRSDLLINVLPWAAASP